MMKTILITGGANGIGKGIALHYLKKGYQVIAVGNSATNGKNLCDEAKSFGAEQNVFYIQGNLSLIKENKRILEEVKNRFSVLDALVFCASKHNKSYIETVERFEFSFALDYLSRFIIAYGLKDCLDKSMNPTILNVCGTGMNGEVNWEDLQHRDNFAHQKVMMHGSRLNDLSGVAFANNDTVSKIKYILYNPWAVKTPGMTEYGSPLMKFAYKIIGKSIEEAVIPISELLDNPPSAAISAYRERKKLDISLATYDREKAKKLYDLTIELLNQTQ